MNALSRFMSMRTYCVYLGIDVKSSNIWDAGLGLIKRARGYF